MKKLIGTLAVSALLTVNAFMFITPSHAGSSVKKGTKGTIDGVATCHCPDDSGDCNCAVSDEDQDA